MDAIQFFKTGDFVKVINPDDENGQFGKIHKISGIVDKAQYGQTGYFYIIKTAFGEISYIGEELEKSDYNAAHSYGL